MYFMSASIWESRRLRFDTFCWMRFSSLVLVFCWLFVVWSCLSSSSNSLSMASLFFVCCSMLCALPVETVAVTKRSMSNILFIVLFGKVGFECFGFLCNSFGWVQFVCLAPIHECQVILFEFVKDMGIVVHYICALFAPVKHCVFENSFCLNIVSHQVQNP